MAKGKEENKSKKTDIEIERERLLNIFNGIDANKLAFVQHNIDNLAWLNVSIAKLRKQIDIDGTSVVYNNGGGQSGLKDNPDVKVLIAYQKNMIAITKQLLEVVPPTSDKNKLLEFLNG